jgi:hypothetical protein
VRRHGGTAPGARPRVHSAFPRGRRD